MLLRLMDLVVLVAELSREGEKSFNELDIELTTRGYSADEIEQAVFWLSSLRDSNATAPGGAHSYRFRARPPVRVLSAFERMSVSAESYGFLLRLLNLGIIDVEQFERIISRSIPVGPEKIPLAEVKEIACSVIFDREPSTFEDDIIEHFEEDVSAS